MKVKINKKQNEKNLYIELVGKFATEIRAKEQFIAVAESEKEKLSLSAQLTTLQIKLRENEALQHKSEVELFQLLAEEKSTEVDLLGKEYLEILAALDEALTKNETDEDEIKILNTRISFLEKEILTKRFTMEAYFNKACELQNWTP